MEEIKNCIEVRKRHLQSIDPRNPLVGKPAQELAKEIAFLDMELDNMEKDLLSMKRKIFGNIAGSLAPTDDMRNRSGLPRVDSISSRFSQVVKDNATRKNSVCGRSPLSQSASYRTSRPRETDAKAMHSFHCLPLSERGLARKASSVSLAEHLAAVQSTDHVRQTPNRISEEMVKCITAIYCQLAEPPLFYYKSHTSPISFPSSMSESSPQVKYDRSSQHRKNSSSNTRFSNPFHIENSKESSHSYSAMVEIQGICLDASRLIGVQHKLENFRSLVSKLDKVDPRRLKHEEKLAFWINIHNALVMHVFLVNGIPQNNLKRNSLVLEAAYNIGGHIITVDMIQSSILGCRMPRPRQWFQSFFFPKSKSKDEEVKTVYAIGLPQSLLKFALTSGSYSDPMVRVYTPNRLLQELEKAKQEYIQTTCKIENARKIFLPKIVDSYAKELGLCSADLFQMIAHSTSYYILQKCIHQPLQQNKLFKNVEWIPHNFDFRYLFEPELAK